MWIFPKKDLIEVDQRMEVANRASIKIDGAILVRFCGMNDTGQLMEAVVMVYISPDSKQFYLSNEANMHQHAVLTWTLQIAQFVTAPNACPNPPGKLDCLPLETCLEGIAEEKVCRFYI